MADPTLTKEQQFICGYRIDFSDGGEPEGKILHVGTKEECERMADLFPAVSYSGDRPNPRASMLIVPAPPEAT